MEGRRYEARHIFLAISICIALSALYLFIIVPQMVVNLAHRTPDVWHVFVSKENYVVCGVAFLFLVLAPFIIFLLDIKISSILLSLGSLLLCVATLYVSTHSYTILADDQIKYRTLQSETYSYTWDDVEKVIYIRSQPGQFGEYEFLFVDGNRKSLIENGYFSAIAKMVMHKIEEKGIELDRQI